MKAAVIERQGGLENLVYGTGLIRFRANGEVLVRVRGCGLNHLDIFVRRGMPGFPFQCRSFRAAISPAKLRHSGPMCRDGRSGRGRAASGNP